MALPSPLGDADSLRLRDDEHDPVPSWVCATPDNADAEWMKLY